MPPHFLFHLLIISASFAHSPRHNTSLPFFLFSHDRFFSSTIYWTASKFLLDVLFFFQILFYPPFLSPASSLHRRISSLNSTCLSTDSPNYVLYSEANLFLSWNFPAAISFVPIALVVPPTPIFTGLSQIHLHHAPPVAPFFPRTLADF